MTEHWHLILPLVLGATALYLLLPRPTPYPTWWGAGLGTVALVLGGMLIVRTDVLHVESLLFYAFSAIAIIAATLLIVVQNPARAALSFTLVVLSTCGLFLLLAAPFLTAATVIVYAGAIVVTFLFVIMLAQQAGLSDADARSREPFLAALTGFLLLGTILFVLDRGHGTQELDALLAQTEQAQQETSLKEIDEQTTELFRQYREYFKAMKMLDLRDQVLDLQLNSGSIASGENEESLAHSRETLDKLKVIGEEARNRTRLTLGMVQLDPATKRSLSNMSGPAADTPVEQVRRDEADRPQFPAENTAYLGKSLFTDYLLPVELAGVLLLVAIVGAIAISQRNEPEGQA